MHARSGSSFAAVLFALVLGGLIGAAATYILFQPNAAVPESPAVLGTPSPPSTGAAVQAQETREDAITRKLREWNLNPDELRREMDRAGRVFRAIGRQVAEGTSDMRIIAVIKAKYTLDDHLSAWNISVGCKDGHVTLTGTVSSAELLGRAIVLALDTDGVIDVDSSLRVKPGEKEPGPA